MIARLILILLLVAFAVPSAASASCHEGSGVMTGMAMSRPMPSPASGRDDKALATHACMGCIPPIMLLRAAMSAPPTRAGMRCAAAISRFDVHRPGPPATPPPRSAA